MNRKSKYDECDWSEGDIELAKEFGVTRQSIAAARKVRGIKPATPHGGKREGAGRKSRSTPLRAITIRVNIEIAEKLNAICKAKDRSQAAQVTEWVKRARI